MQKLITNLFYPARCPLCDRCIDERFGIACPSCVRQITYVTEPRCKVCGKPLLSDEEELCPDCASTRHRFTQGRAAFVYKGAVRKSMYRFKYANRRRYAAFYAREFVRINGFWLKQMNIEAIVPIPLHKDRQRRRGYNQAALFANVLSELTGIATREDLLSRVKKTVPQKELDSVHRKNNLKNAFKSSEDGLQFKNILLVDDIYTTGSTADAAAAALKKAGADAVYLGCICIGESF